MMDLWERFLTMPRWVIVSIVVGGGLLAWYFIHVSSSPTTGSSSDSWRDQARELLIGRGYNPEQVATALSHYFDGGALSPQDSALISTAIMALGWPSTGNSSSPDYATSNPVTDPGPGAPYASNVSTSTGGVGNSGNPDLQNVNESDAPTGSWSVISVGFGWTSTLRGIAANFYGNPTLGAKLLAYNPGVASSDYARIPPGTRVTIPRQLQN